MLEGQPGMIGVSEVMADAPLTSYRGPERRRQGRLNMPLPARVTGVDSGGEFFDLDITVDNISSGGFHATLPRRVVAGARLAATISFSPGGVAQTRGTFLSVHGKVRHAVCHADGTCGVGVEFEHSQFL